MNKQKQKNKKEFSGTIVIIEMGYTDENIGGRGTGFFIDDNKIITNIHVLAGAKDVNARNVSTGMVYTIEGVISFDDINDLVVLQTSECDKPFPIEDSNNVKIGDKITAIGCPDGNERIAEGIIHGIRHHNKSFRVQMPNASKGFSGGPVINSNGRIIAILDQLNYVEGSLDYDFGNAISSNTIKELTKKSSVHLEPISKWLRRPSVHAYFLYYNGIELSQEGNQKGAIATYNKTIKLNPNLANALHNRGLAKNNLRKHKNAIADYDAALKLEPDSALSYSNRGASNIALKNFEQALEDCNAALKINPDLLIAHCNRALAKVSLNDYQGALDDANVVLQKHTDAFESFRLYLACSAANIALGDFAEALKDINTVIKRNPNFAESYVMRALIKKELNDYLGAIKDADKMIKMKPMSEMGYTCRATVYLELGKSKLENEEKKASQDFYDKALVDANKAVKLNRKSHSSYASRGKVRMYFGVSEAAQGEIEEAKKLFNSAISDYTKSIQLNSRSAASLNALGWVNYNIGKLESTHGKEDAAQKHFQKAVIESEEAIRFDKDSFAVYAYYHTHGVAKAALRDFEKAIEDFSEAINRNPKHILSYQDRAKAKEALGLADDAADDYQTVEKLEAS